jgi:hypothetical protein
MSNNFKSFRFLLFKSIYNIKTKKNREHINKIVDTIEVKDLKDEYQIKWFDNKINDLQVDKKKFKFYTRGDILLNEPLDNTDFIEKNNHSEIKNILQTIFNEKNFHKRKNLNINPEISVFLFYNFLFLLLLFFKLVDYKVILLINIISIAEIFIKNNLIKNLGLLILSISSLKLNFIFFFLINLLILFNFLKSNRKYLEIIIFLTLLTLLFSYSLIFSYQNNIKILSALSLIFIFIFRNLFYKYSNTYIFVFLLIMILSTNLSILAIFLPTIALLDIIFFNILFKIFPVQRGNI